MNKPWICFFSQTGTEIVDLVERLGRLPDRIITNERPENLRQINKQILSWGNIEEILYYTPNKPTVEDYERLLSKFDNPVITLHGWLRVIPPELCEKYTMFNGHPGLITDYPELKGKDPQVRAFADINKYKVIGSVIHRVTEEIDGGEVVVIAEQAVEGSPLKINSIDGMFNVCTALSLITWLSFFRNSDIILETELNYDGTFKNDRENCIPIYCK